MAARSLPTAPNFTANMELTSTLMNQISTYMTFWANRPMFRMYQSVAQSVPNNAFTQLTLDTSDYDTDSGRQSISPWSYVVPYAGRWRFAGIVGFAANATGARFAAFYKNGAAVSTMQVGVPVVAAGNGSDMPMATDTIACNAGDVMALYGFQTSGGALNTDVPHVVFSGVLESLASP